MKPLSQLTPIFALLVLAAACGPVTLPPPSAPPVPDASADTCNARQYAGLIGQDATALERVMILGQVRVIRPGDAVTMDFRNERINFDINGANQIAAIRCG